MTDNADDSTSGISIVTGSLVSFPITAHMDSRHFFDEDLGGTGSSMMSQARVHANRYNNNNQQSDHQNMHAAKGSITFNSTFKIPDNAPFHAGIEDKGSLDSNIDYNIVNNELSSIPIEAENMYHQDINEFQNKLFHDSNQNLHTTKGSFVYGTDSLSHTNLNIIVGEGGRSISKEARNFTCSSSFMPPDPRGLNDEDRRHRITADNGDHLLESTTSRNRTDLCFLDPRQKDPNINPSHHENLDNNQRKDFQNIANVMRLLNTATKSNIEHNNPEPGDSEINSNLITNMTCNHWKPRNQREQDSITDTLSHDRDEVHGCDIIENSAVDDDNNEQLHSKDRKIIGRRKIYDPG